MLGVAPLLSTVLCWKNHLFSSEGQFISSVKMQVATFPTKTTVCPGHMTPCGLTGQLRGLKIRCSLINAGPKSVRHPSSGGGNRLQVHLSPSNWQKTPKQTPNTCKEHSTCVSNTLCPRFQEFHTTSAPSPGRTRVCETLKTRQTRGGDEFISLLSSLLKCSCVACKKNKKIFKKGRRWWWQRGVGGERKCEALTRALRHNHDTIKIISQRLLVARKAIFTPCNRVWLSD